MRPKTSKNNVADIYGDLYENPAFIGGATLIDDVKIFSITFDWTPDDDDGGDFTIRHFRLHTGIKNTVARISGDTYEREFIIDMPKESYDYAEKLLWNKVRADDDFIYSIEHPEDTICGHDLAKS